MLDVSDRVVLADGVRLERNVIVDELRTIRMPVNATGLFVLRRERLPLGEVAEQLSLAFDVDPATARDDVFAFAFRLNRLLLVDIVTGRSRLARARGWVASVLRLAPVARAPGAAWRRVSIDTRSPQRAAAVTLWALRGRATVVAVLSFGLAFQAAALSGAATLLPTLAVAAAVGLGLALHEAGHAAALAGIPGALVLSGVRTYVTHPVLAGPRRRLVAAAGPVAPLVLAVGLVAIARPLGSTALALGACALASHGVGLTVATADGRTACLS